MNGPTVAIGALGAAALAFTFGALCGPRFTLFGAMLVCACLWLALGVHLFG